MQLASFIFFEQNKKNVGVFFSFAVILFRIYYFLFKSIIMTYLIQLLDPRAQNLLDVLVDLNLIKFVNPAF
jgi:hypothetical protein